MDITLAVTCAVDDAKVEKNRRRANGSGAAAWPAYVQIECAVTDALRCLDIVDGTTVNVIAVKA